MLLVIDNYDSFTYNLVQYLGELGAEIVVRRNDDVTVDEVGVLAPSAIVLSPGPCAPAQAGVTVDVIRRWGATIPTLGVCLGHQAIGEAYGGRVVRAARAVHGKTSRIDHDGRDLFAGLPTPLEVGRYHSLVVERDTLPDALEVVATAVDDPREIHALRHRSHPVWGVQFHPESVLTSNGKQLLRNFLDRVVTRAVVLSLATAFAAAVPASAQLVTIVDRGAGQAAALVDSVTSAPHVLRAGSGPLVLPRDSTVTTSLLVLGRPTYLASQVQGDVVVVGGDLFLRPGAEISGRAVAIGGTVAETALGHVGGGVQSLRDETFAVEGGAAGYTLSARSLRVGGDTLSDSLRIFRLAGIRGLLIPRYDRVDGLSLPLGVQLNLARQQLLLQPTVTYRSRLGVLDPGVSLRVGPEEGTRFEGRVARDTRSNELWITSELINSLKTLAFGTDTRNYFRSDIVEGRLFLRTGGGGESEGATLEPFIGARAERVSSISATGDVFSFFHRHDDEKMARPNPAVDQGTIGSVLLGLLYQSAPDNAALISRFFVEAEQGVTTPVGTSSFTQLTADGRVEFPTFGLQRLRFRGHAVATRGDSVPRARYAYLGGSRTLGLSELLEYGGAALVFVESRYLIPVPSLQLPVVGPPTLVLIQRMGGAGIRSISPLQQEVGAGLSLGPIDLELITGASGQHKTEFGVGVSLPAF